MKRSKFNKKFKISSIKTIFLTLIFICTISLIVGFSTNLLEKDIFDNSSNSEEEIDDKENTKTIEIDEPTSVEVKDEDTSSVYDSDAVKGLMDGVSENAYDDIAEDQFVYVINRKIYMKDGKSPASVCIFNPKNNNFNLSVEIEIDDKTVYKTKIIKPNYHIAQDVFDVTLSQGEYDAVINITAYDNETNEVEDVYTDNITVTVNA